jgi:hypothetical protein
MRRMRIGPSSRVRDGALACAVLLLGAAKLTGIAVTLSGDARSWADRSR